MDGLDSSVLIRLVKKESGRSQSELIVGAQAIIGVLMVDARHIC